MEEQLKTDLGTDRADRANRTDRADRTDVSAVILAAGTSSRMGQPKQLLPLGGQYLLERVIRQCLRFAFQRVIAVIGHQAPSIQEAIPIADPRFAWVVNRDYQGGQSASLKLGMNKAAASGVMVFLGDMPLIRHSTVEQVLRRGRRHLQESEEPFVLQPSYKGVPGHPVFFGRLPSDACSRLKGDQGAKPVVRSLSNRIHLEVDDPGILFDVDTPEAYQEARKYFS
ncbi:hypothetical protein BSNK01_30750 [Bacillaceae bacterium]